MKTVSFAKILEFIGADGVGSEKFIKELFLSYHASQRRVGGKVINNIIAYGPGGFGKSTIALKFLQAIGETDYRIFDAHSETSTEKLFGGMNYPKYINDGVIRYNIDDSWMNCKVAIFEEGLSMPAKTITALRNLLQSGQFNNGSEVIDIKTEWIILLTNRNPSDFAGNEDMDALLQRFPYRCQVDWSHMSSAQIVDSFTRIIENEGLINVDDTDTRVLAQVLATNDGTSPRLAKLFAGRVNISKEFFGTSDIETLCESYGFQCSDLEEILRDEANKRINSVVTEQMDVVQAIENGALKDVMNKSGNSLELLRVANAMIDKCRETIRQAVVENNRYFASDPYEVTVAMGQISAKQSQLREIAGSIALR